MGSRWASKIYVTTNCPRSDAGVKIELDVQALVFLRFYGNYFISYGSIHYIRHRVNLTHVTQSTLRSYARDPSTRYITWRNAVPYMCPLPYSKKTTSNPCFDSLPSTLHMYICNEHLPLTDGSLVDPPLRQRARLKGQTAGRRSIMRAAEGNTTGKSLIRRRVGNC